MGFERVYDYEHGKRDWGSSGLPREGTKTLEPSGGDLARRDVPTCRLEDDLAEVRRQVRESGWQTCMVVNEHGIVLGRLGRKALGEDTTSSVEEAMTEGPSTVRPSIGAGALVERMKENSRTSFVVTTSDGKLVGLALLDEAEEKLQA
jgi:CBS-domain-containing membrane protein